jgi:peptidoglycan hydrolase CwlO-like protein
MDEMEIEFKRLLAECEFKLKDKQNSIDQLNLQLQNISTTIQDKEYFKTENETLKKELATVQNELNSLTHNIKRF